MRSTKGWIDDLEVLFLCFVIGDDYICGEDVAVHITEKFGI